MTGYAVQPDLPAEVRALFIFACFRSMFALISLHVFLYGCNLLAWKSSRISHNFIFDFSPSTALTHRDAFLLSASIMCTVVAALVVNLFLSNAGATYANALPGALLLLSAAALFCPFNVFYRSTRYCFMRVMRNIMLSPFYKVKEGPLGFQF
jgi:xenotropic and polytropic retrovirus receptor 1